MLIRASNVCVYNPYLLIAGLSHLVISRQVWRIEDLQRAPVEMKKYGQFYGGDCYLVLYTYMKSGRPHYILYMWLVSQSPVR